jgi:hypothetical protein
LRFVRKIARSPRPLLPSRKLNKSLPAERILASNEEAIARSRVACDIIIHRDRGIAAPSACRIKLCPTAESPETHRHVAGTVFLADAAQILRAQGAAHNVRQGDEVVAESYEDDRSLRVAEARRLHPEGQQGEEGGEEAKPGPSGHPALGEAFVL